MMMNFVKASSLMRSSAETTTIFPQKSLDLDEVLRIKRLLDHSQDQPGKFILESLRLLQSMELPQEIINATGISSSVKCMLKNTYERIRQQLEVISLGSTILLNDRMHETKGTKETTTPDTALSFPAEEEQQLLFHDGLSTFPPLDAEDLIAPQAVDLSKNSIANFFDGIDDDESFTCEGVFKETDKESHFDCHIIEKKDNGEKMKKRPRIIVKPLKPRANSNETVNPMNGRRPLISPGELAKDLKKVNSDEITEEEAEGLAFRDEPVIKKRKLLPEKFEEVKKDNGEMKRPQTVVKPLKPQRIFNEMASPMNAMSPLVQEMKESIADENIKEKSKALSFQDKPEINKRKLPPERYQEGNNATKEQNVNAMDVKISSKQVFKQINFSEKNSKLIQIQDSLMRVPTLSPHVQDKPEKRNYVDKLEITKRRLRDSYENANDERKKHCVKLIDLNELQVQQPKKEIKPKAKRGCPISTYTKAAHK